jgi:hypothetical protein
VYGFLSSELCKFHLIFQGWPMTDWFATLKSGREYIDALQTDWTVAGSSSATSGEQSPASIQGKLFQDLAMIDQQKKGTKMLFNVQVAAIHLSYLLQGCGGTPSLVCSFTCTVSQDYTCRLTPSVSRAVSSEFSFFSFAKSLSTH